MKGEDIDEYDCVWTDSPVNGKTDQPVYNLGINTDFLDDDLFEFIAHTAADNDLQVFDMQAGLLYRTDRTVVDSNGQIFNLPPKQTKKASKPKSKTKLTEEGATRYLIKHFAKVFADEGWFVNLEGNQAHNWELSRQNGDILQVINLNAYSHNVDCSFSVYFYFYHEQIFTTFRELVPVEKAGLSDTDIKHRKKYEGINLELKQLFPPEIYQGIVQHPNFLDHFIKTQKELEEWSRIFHQWYRQFASPQLAMAKDIVSLSELLDSEHHRKCSLHQTTNTRPFYPKLILAHLASTQHLENWINVVKSRFQMELGKIVTEYGGMPENLDDNSDFVTFLQERQYRWAIDKFRAWKPMLTFLDKLAEMHQFPYK